MGGTDTADFPDFNGSNIALTVLYGVAGAAFALALRYYASRRDPLQVALGALVWLSAVHVLLMAASPLAIALTTWSLLAGVVGVIVWTFAPASAALPVLALAAAPPLFVLLPQLALWVDSPSEPMALMMLVAILLFGSLVPHLIVLLGSPVSRGD